jgi:exopolysaccharide biosynthesis polyprenyl glycosylphosphotransferase
MRAIATFILRLLPVMDALLVASTLAWIWVLSLPQSLSEVVLLLLVVPFCGTLFKYFGLYDSHRFESLAKVFRQILSAQVVGSLIIAFALILVGKRNDHVAAFFAVSTVVLVVQRGIVYGILRILRRRGIDPRSVCVIGSWERIEVLRAEFASHAEWGATITSVGCGSHDHRRFVAYPSRMPLADSLEALLCQVPLDEVLIAVLPEELPAERPSLRLCEQYGVLARVSLDLRETGGLRARVEPFGGELTLAVGGTPRTDLAIIVKRLFDLALASMSLLCLSPLLFVIAVLVKLSSEGPIIFKQIRVGLNGRRFTIYKFRTMINGAELLARSASRSITRGPAFKDPHDYRTTEIGGILRRFSFDELPQLINVIKGEMSLVGPRPLPVEEACAVSGPHRRRFSVLPGVTCLWQVNGRSDIDYETWMRYDLAYVDGWSLWLDTKLLLQTIPAVFSGRGSY